MRKLAEAALPPLAGAGSWGAGAPMFSMDRNAFAASPPPPVLTLRDMVATIWGWG